MCFFTMPIISQTGKYIEYAMVWMIRGSNSCRCKKFMSSRKGPYDFWDSLNFQFSGYKRTLLRIKRLEREVGYSFLSSANIVKHFKIFHFLRSATLQTFSCYIPLRYTDVKIQFIMIYFIQSAHLIYFIAGIQLYVSITRSHHKDNNYFISVQ